MKTKYLNVGDVFAVGYGMKVYHKDDDDDFSYALAVIPTLTAMFKELEKIALETHQKYPFVGYHPCLAFIKKEYEETKEKNHDTSMLAGEYVVIGTALTGGGGNDYSNGHEVTAQKLKGGKYDPKGEIIRFYQSGSFTATNVDVPVIRKMHMSFV